MATDSLSYSGINRAVSDYSGAKFCEELINLRPTSYGLVPVKPFTIKYANSPYYKIFVHHTTDGDKYIGVRKVPSSYKVVVELIGNTTTTLFERTMTGSVSYEKTHKMNLYADNLFFAAAGNIILFSERAIDQYAPPFENVAFTWKNNAYVRTEANVPEIDYTISDGGTITGVWASVAHVDSSSDHEEVVGSVQSGLNAAQETEPSVCFGPIIIAIAFKTTDGNTFWTGKWKIYDPIPTIKSASDSPYVDPTIRTSSIYDDFFDKYGFGYECGGTHGDFLNHIYVYGTKVRLTLSSLQDSNSSQANYWNKNTSIIQSVEVYSSRPAVYLDKDSAFDGLLELGPTAPEDDYLLVLAQTGYDEMELDGQAMYLQASVPMTSLLGTTQNVDLSFGGNIQTTNETLRVDAGALTRYGHLLSYNARFHYYDSSSELSLGKPFFLQEPNGSAVSTDVFVLYEDQDTRDEFYVGRWSLYDGDETLIVIAPSVNITEVITRAVGSTYVQRYRMTASRTYNYSIHVGHMDTDVAEGTTEQTKLSNLVSAGVVPIVSGEPAAINVTEQYNPFVFRVEHSYLAPGNVTDLVPQQYVVTDATYGREPLDVFTTQGVYALIQGNGEILYSWFDPISPMIAEGPAVPTEMGIFFISGGALWLCAGHRTTLVSDALSVGPHKYIRACDGYKKISGQDSNYSPNPVISSPAYDVSSNLSQVEFETFASGNSAQSIGRGRLSYNRFRQEVYVSNGSYQYSYVLSLKYRQWFKVPYYIMQDEQASVLAKIPSPTESGNDYVDLSAESSSTHVTFHMQSRPFSMGYQYIHMHRLISQMRASLASGDLVVVGLYGSDDLQEWKLLAYSKRSGASTPLKVSQIRTSSSARSWRYYTICIGGTVYAGAVDNTDIGPFLVDYEPVVRRIG